VVEILSLFFISVCVEIILRFPGAGNIEQVGGILFQFTDNNCVGNTVCVLQEINQE
jgi:hypothetical protein